MEDSQTLLEQKIRDADVAKETEVQIEPSEYTMSVAQMESAGYVYIYDTKTGDRSLCNRNMLVRKLNQKRPDGSYVFTTVKPPFSPKKGTYKCMLHKDDPFRKHYDDLGFAVCSKGSLLSPFHVRRHMQKRHKVEWEAIEEERKDREKQEEKEFQRSILRGVRIPETKKYTCDICGKSFDKPIALAGHKRKHK